MSSKLFNPANSQIVFADHAGDFSAGVPATAANNLIEGTIGTSVQMDLGGLGSGSAYQSAKFSFPANRAPVYRIDICLEHASAVADGESCDIWLAQSSSSTAGTGNPAGLTGSAGSFTWTNGAQRQLGPEVGSLGLRATTLNIGFAGFFRPVLQHGILVFRNKPGVALAATADEMHIVLTPAEYSDL